MKSRANWKCTKFNIVDGRLRASTSPREVAYGSWLTTERIATFYDRAIPIYAKGRLIDLGCGKAPLYAKYRDFVEEVTCVDWGHSVHQNEYVDFECDLNEVLPFGDRSFDTIVLSDVLEHVAQPEHLWVEMHRILVGGGCVLLNTPYLYPLHEVPYDFYRYSEFCLRRFAEKSGFRILELSATGGSPEVLADIIGKHLQFVPWIGGVLARLVQRITHLFVRTSLGGRISSRTSERFPLGYVMVVQKIGA